MKVLLVSNLYPPFFVGGYEIACKDIADCLRQRGHDIYVLTSTYGVDAKVREENVFRVLDLYQELHTGRPSAIPATHFESHNYFASREVMGEIKPDVVYVWSLSQITLGPALAAQELGLKVVYHVFDYSLLGYR